MLRSITKITSLIFNNKFTCFTVDPFTKHYAQMQMRATRRKFLNQAVLNKNKTVVYAELRKTENTLLSLKKQGLCSGVISRNSGEKDDEVDIVLRGGMIKTMMRHPNYGKQTVYIRV
eukprot:GHVR01113904.1.p1 GENE.GHVR01113904.1~~GHVR01113904.1.p1  ORF type:complete len:117 (-),score=0.45 GHVR01113904.1:591-941(-)